MTYGEGAVMGVPAHDERDFQFAKKYGIDIQQVIQVPGRDYSETAWGDWYVEKGTCINSGSYDGMQFHDSLEAITKD